MGNAGKGLSLQIRIGLGFGAVLLLMGASGGKAVLSLRDTQTLFHQYSEASRTGAAVGEMRASFYGARMAAEAFVLSLDSAKFDEAQGALATALRHEQAARAAADAPEIEAELAGIEARLVAFQKLMAELRTGLSMQIEASEKVGAQGQIVTKAIEASATALERRRAALGPAIEVMMGAALQLATLMMGLALLVGCAVSLLVGRSVARPITQMTAAMRGIADGDLGIQVPAQGRRDEIGAMAAALAVFKDNAARVAALRDEQARTEEAAASRRRAEMMGLADGFEASVKSVVDLVAASSRHLRSSSDAVARTAEDATRRSTDVATQAREASSDVTTVASASEELSASVAEIAQQAARSAAMAKDAERRSRETTGTVRALSEAAGRIGEVVTLISAIADQTNLLALNATIEAARAGEAGRGFAVVASEVKSLASQTAKATQDISQQIDGVQGATTEAVRAIETIGRTIEDLNQVATSIAAAVEEQRAVVEEISRSTAKVAATTEAVTANIGHVREGAATTVSAARQSLAAAEDLGGQADRLDQEVVDFLRRVRAG